MKKILRSIAILCSINISLFCLQLKSQSQIRLYSFYTDSHEIFKKDWFIPSMKDNYEVIIKYYRQECPSGKYRSKGWVKTMMRKVDLILDAIEENWGNFFIYADIDIQFFGSTEELIRNSIKHQDIVFQRESPTGDIGAGFMVIRANENTRNLWQQVKFYMQQSPGKTDQLALNFLLRKTNHCQLKWDYLPVAFFAGGTLTGKIWKPGKILKLPKDIILHHANSTIGIPNKLKQLRYVKDQIRQ